MFLSTLFLRPQTLRLKYSGEFLVLTLWKWWVFVDKFIRKIILKNLNKLFWWKNVYEILNARVPNSTNYQEICNFTVVYVKILQYQFNYNISAVRNNNRFKKAFTTFVVEQTTAKIQFEKQSMNTWPWWCFIAKNRIKLIYALLFRQ